MQIDQVLTSSSQPLASHLPALISVPQKPTAPRLRPEGRKPKTPRFLALARPLGGILPLG